MLFKNVELDRAFAFIAQSDFDIFCLQEVPEEFLARLQTLPFFAVFRTDVERPLNEGVVRNYVVILSKHPIASDGAVPFPDYWSRMPLRSHLFVLCMRSLGFTKVRNRNGIFADIAIPGMTHAMRVFNLHLILAAQPAWRLKEFELAMAKSDAMRPMIVCGDFNTLEAPRITILNWIFGGRMSDALLYHRERTTIERRFSEYKLRNPLLGKITHRLSRSQLDHILVSDSFFIKSAQVLPDSVGSDHHPIRVEIE